MLFWIVFLAGVVLTAAGLLLKPKHAGLGWALDFGFGDRATRPERILFFAGIALMLLGVVLLRSR